MVTPELVYAQIEKEIFKESEQHSKYIDQKSSLEISVQKYKQKVQAITIEIQSLQSQLKTLRDKRDKAKQQKEIHDLIKSSENELITEYLIKLQSKINMNFIDKYEINGLDMLKHLEKTLTIPYIIIKKLVITEDFIKECKVLIPTNIFEEQMFILSKIGKLNYYSFDNKCGPVLMFRLTSSTTFDDILIKSCKLWGLYKGQYTFYDDCFNNLGCCLSSQIQQFFTCYKITDMTIPYGYAFFYIIKKMTSQTKILKLQQKSFMINKQKDIQNVYNDMMSTVVNDFDQCFNILNEGKVLKGLLSLQSEKKTSKDALISKAKNVENYWFFAAISLSLLITSLYSSIMKRQDVIEWNTIGVSYNAYLDQILTSLSSLPLITMNDYMKYLLSITDQPQTMMDYYKLSYYSHITFRILMVNEVNCLSHFKVDKLYSDFINPHEKCYSFHHDKKTRKETGLPMLQSYSYSFKNEKETNITTNLNTVIGIIDRTGTLIQYIHSKTIETSKVKSDLNQLLNGGLLLQDDISGIDLSFVLKHQMTDVYISNKILIQNDINSRPMITLLDSIPFTDDVYKFTKTSFSLEIMDYYRLVAYYILILPIILRIIQLCLQTKFNGWTILIEIIDRCVEIPNLIFLSSFTFYNVSFFMLWSYNKDFSNYDNYINQNNGQFYSYDFYNFAMKQKDAINYDIASVFLIGIFILRYVLLIWRFNIVIETYKRISFEYIVVFVLLIAGFAFGSLFTWFIFGNDIYEYSNFFSSLTINIQFILFGEETNIPLQLLKTKRLFSAFFIVFVVFLVRFFLMGLFFPIFIENYRIEDEKYSQVKKDDKSKKSMSFLDVIELIFYPCLMKGKIQKKEIDEMKIKESNDMNNNKEQLKDNDNK